MVVLYTIFQEIIDKYLFLKFVIYFKILLSLIINIKSILYFNKNMAHNDPHFGKSYDKIKALMSLNEVS